MCIADCMQITFFYLGRFLKKLSGDQCSSTTEGSIYHIKHLSMHPFTMGVDPGSGLTRNGTFNGSIYYVWYLHILRFYFVWQRSIAKWMQVTMKPWAWKQWWYDSIWSYVSPIHITWKVHFWIRVGWNTMLKVETVCYCYLTSQNVLELKNVIIFLSSL